MWQSLSKGHFSPQLVFPIGKLEEDKCVWNDYPLYVMSVNSVEQCRTVSTVSTVIARCYLHLRWYFCHCSTIKGTLLNTLYHKWRQLGTTWELHGQHMGTTSYNLETTWHLVSLGCHLVTTNVSLGCFVGGTWVSFGCHLTTYWLLGERISALLAAYGHFFSTLHPL